MKFPTDKEACKRLGKRIVLHRKQNNMSQADLSYEAEIDLSTLSRLERGMLNVGFLTLYKVAKALKVPVRDLFDF